MHNTSISVTAQAATDFAPVTLAGSGRPARLRQPVSDQSRREIATDTIFATESPVPKKSIGRASATCVTGQFDLVGDCVGQSNDVGPNVLVFDPAEGLAEFDGFLIGHEVGIDRFAVDRYWKFFIIGPFFEKECDGYSQEIGDGQEPTSADATVAIFVFLDLLERQVEHFAKIFLRVSKHDASKSYALRDMNVYLVGLFLVGHGYLSREKYQSCTG